jgi:hypothetical protein
LLFERLLAMILTLFSFGLSWVVLALVFFWLTHLLPGFHSVYFQTVLGVGFLIGFFDAVIAKAALTMGFRPFNPLVYLIIAATDYVLMQLTSNISMGYYLTGHRGTALAAIALAGVAFVIEMGTDRVLKDA